MQYRDMYFPIHIDYYGDDIMIETSVLIWNWQNLNIHVALHPPRGWAAKNAGRRRKTLYEQFQM